MESRWSDADAQAFVDRYAGGHGEVVALRVYTSRLIGADPALVMHGGGNTSAKGEVVDLTGEPQAAIFVKGSGWNLDTIEPAGLPAVDLDYLRRLRARDALTDEAMVNALRTHLFDAQAPTPSVETLLHAFLPHTFVDHSHADAILALTNQPDGEEHVRAALGDDCLCLPYIMPGFPLAKAVVEAWEAQPSARAMVLAKHGLFTFADDARASYEEHVRLVDRAERYLAAHPPARPLQGTTTPAEAAARAALFLPLLRGLLKEMDEGGRRWILDHRASEAILAFCDDEAGRELARSAPLTPDHVIRTKAHPLVLDEPAWHDPAVLREQLARALEEYREEYEVYFDENLRAKGVERTRLDPLPRVVVAAGLGQVGIGESAKAAAIAGDLYEHTVAVKTASRGLGPYQGLDLADLFDMEYWSLEQAKLGKASPPPLAGRIALVTGAAGAIGAAIARRLAQAGACVALADIDAERLAAAGDRLGQQPHLAVQMDVTDSASVDAGVDAVCRRFGGLDLCVLNAGVAHVARLADLTDADLARVLDINAQGYHRVLRAAARVMERQGSGGHIVVNSSKNVFAPGAGFGAYSAAKAAAHQLGKIAALELAPLAIRVNMINADAVFGDEKIPSLLWQEVGPERMRARGLDEAGLRAYYRDRNLLKAEVTADHVANGVLFFVTDQTPTTGATLPIDGGIPEAFPR
jgi:rhamnulose-1-phosphate aldolase/alcohol dehydrogenase